MDEAASMYSNLNDQIQFRLNKINKIKDYFIAEIRERGTMSKRLIKYITAFDYFRKTLIILYATKCGVSIGFFASGTDATVGIASASYSFAFPLTTLLLMKKRNTEY